MSLLQKTFLQCHSGHTYLGVSPIEYRGAYVNQLALATADLLSTLMQAGTGKVCPKRLLLSFTTPKTFIHCHHPGSETITTWARKWIFQAPSGKWMEFVAGWLCFTFCSCF